MPRLLTPLAVLTMLVAALIAAAHDKTRVLAFDGHFVFDGYAAFLKVLILVGASGALLLAGQFMRDEKIERYEYPLLVLFSALGMCMMVSANSFLALYMAIELQSLPIYVLAAVHRDNLRSTEAGLKYFVLGALASGMLLYGCSLVYGFSGTLNFDVLAGLWTAETALPLGALIGLVFVISGLAFKMAAVPFHMWTPDVYEGAPSPVTAFMAGAPKVAAVGLMLRVLMGPFGAWAVQWQQVVVVLALASMALGAFAAIGQLNIKRLMAYSGIANIGFALVGVAAGHHGRRQCGPGLHGALPGHDPGHLRLHPADATRRQVCRDHRRSRRPVARPADDGAGAGDLHVLAGRHPAAGRLHRQVLRLPRRDRCRPGLVRGGGRASCRWWAPTTICGSSRCSISTSLRPRSTPSPSPAVERRRRDLRRPAPVLPGAVPVRAGADLGHRGGCGPGEVRGTEFGHGFRLLDLATVGSTNDVVRGLAEAGEPAGLFVRAERQTAGRGRHGRSWQSPPGNLYASLLLRPTRPPAEVASLSLVAALALAEAIERVSGGRIAPRLKWPNDLQIDGAKLAGILLEMAADGQGGCAWLIMGIGVNVGWAPAGRSALSRDLPDRPGLQRHAAAVAGGAVPQPCGRGSTIGIATASRRLREDWLARAAGRGSPASIARRRPRRARQAGRRRYRRCSAAGAGRRHRGDLLGRRDRARLSGAPMDWPNRPVGR